MHYPIDHSDTPIRLFENDFLEFFTHISPITVIVIWLPFAGYMLGRGIAYRPADASWLFIPAAFLIGLFVWTLSEYTLHRFVFHFVPRNPTQEKIIYLFHGIHHHQPQCKTRLVMPPVVSIPLAFVFYGLFRLRVFSSIGYGSALPDGHPWGRPNLSHGMSATRHRISFIGQAAHGPSRVLPRDCGGICIAIRGGVGGQRQGNPDRSRSFARSARHCRCPPHRGACVGLKRRRWLCD